MGVGKSIDGSPWTAAGGANDAARADRRAVANGIESGLGDHADSAAVVRNSLARERAWETTAGLASKETTTSSSP